MQNIEVRLHMEKGAYARLVDRAQELGVPVLTEDEFQAQKTAVLRARQKS